MTEQEFKPGDIVKLKSGSLLMTVEEVEPDGTVIAVWNTGRGIKQHDFNPVTLVHANESVDKAKLYPKGC